MRTFILLCFTITFASACSFKGCGKLDLEINEAAAVENSDAKE